MENLEVSLSSLAIISRHVEKSHNQISQYLSKQLQIWSQQDRQSILECLAQLLLEKDYTLLIARHVRPLVLDLLERNAERVKAGGRINHDFHERLCVALSRLLSISPDAHFAVRYFSSAPPVFQRLFFTSEQSSAVQYGPRRMKLRDLMAATLRFLQSDCAKFRMLWDWSPCVSQLLTSDVMVRSTAQCLALVCHMTDNQKAIFLRKVLSSDEILHMKMALEESQQVEAERALVLTNQRSVKWHQELAQKFTRGQVVSEDLSQNVVAVCGVILPKMVPRQQAEQVKPSHLVLVESTCQNLRRLALAVASQKPVLLEGPIGCGKTALVEHMAAVTGHTNASDILKVQLGDQTDSKMLLGMYRCTDVPGKFVWQPGTLTQAVSKGLWILLEDIDHAPLDVISVLLPLMENKKLMIPGREDCIEVAPGFQFFATRGGNWHKPQNSHAALLDKFWTKLQMRNMSHAELKKVLIHRYPMLAVVSDRLLDIYCQLTGERHSEVDTSTEGQQDKPEDRSTSLEGRALSMRDLLKWCERISVNFDSACPATAQRVFLEALDCFTAMLSRPASRLRMAEIIGSKLNISNEKISSSKTFAATRPSAVLLEQLAVCVAKGEPVLLVGETGTGKTSTVQHLASVTHKLCVVNMNQQSDTADLLGYKPVDHRQILLPLREAFEDLFSQTYSRKQNLTFLGHVQTCFREKRWQDLLRLMDHVCKSALAKELQEKPESLLQQWEALASKLSQTQQQIRACETAMVFAFVEGTLAKAVKKGHWILLDEINLAAAETLECLSGLLEGSTGSLVLLDRGDTPEHLVRHQDFRLFACMNPATDVGKRNLPLGLRNFTELYVHELENEGDLRILVSDYLKCLNPPKSVISGIIFYLAARREASSRLVDGTGHRPHYSLRTLCRALSYAAANPCLSVQRSLYEGFCLSFLTQLDRSSHPLVQKLVCQHILAGNTKCLKQLIPAPPGRTCVQIEGYWVPQGELEPALDPSYILTSSVKLNLRDLSRVVSATHPVLIQGETSVGKTSLIRWLATATGNQCVRINNHEHTDIQEYIGCYSSDDRGKLVFKEVLLDAMRKGYWVILDELNLAPTDVLEALNRLLDDNRELFVAETQEVIRAHPRFMLFATQNPPGLYGGRKQVLSRAFRNRFVELHFDELPSAELETILHQRCSLPPSYCTKLVKVMLDLQSLRRGSSVFAGKHGFITLRDLFRWAERYRLEEQAEATQDWLQHLADDYMLLAGRVRKQEEEAVILDTLQKHFKRTVNPDSLFSQKQLISQFPAVGSVAAVPEEFRHVVWTQSLRRMAVLLGRALRFGESVLLVGDTCGKTTICQLYAALAGQKFFSVNCHMHMETSDFLGGLRPVRYTQQTVGEDVRLFEWNHGPLVLALKEGGVFLLDEISLADDSVLERLNVLETEKSLVLAEKGSGDNDDVELIRAAAGFRLVATMNPGGDFGKKELSPALRNRFTEIWCPQSSSRSDLVQIIQHNLRSGLSLNIDVAEVMLDFMEWLGQQDFGRRCVLSVRDILSWVNFINAVCERDEASCMTMRTAEEQEEDEEEAEWDLRLDAVTACVHAACLVYIDGLGSGTTVSCADGALAARRMCLAFLQQRLSKTTRIDEEMLEALRVYDPCLPRDPQWGEDFFGISPFYIAIGSEAESRSLSDYALTAGTAAMNAQRLLRALKLQRPVLLEGSPGVGKTSLVAALAKASGNQLVRINLSEQTDITDLFGTDLPVEGGKGGEFAWRDGPLLAALKAGHWVVLDELNLASQSVLEGLNACFDHRAEIYIPELGLSFQVQQKKTKIFGCQNPFTQGGGRKGLPKSFLNRFTQVFVDQLTYKDMEFIGNSIFPAIDKEIIAKMVGFNNRLVQEVCVERLWGQKGSPWEFNLRDVFRWCQLMLTDQSPGFFNPGQHVALVYADRMRTEADKAKVLLVFREVFGEDYEPYCGSKHFHITPLSVQVGFSVLCRSGGAPVDLDPPLSITHQCLKPLESLMKCVDMGWMTIVVGPTASGKTSLVRLLALLTGHRLRVLAMNSAMDTTELLGGFEQVDIMRPWQQVLETVDYMVAMVIRRGLMSLNDGTQDTEFLLQTWGVFCQWLKENGLQRPTGAVTCEALNKMEVIILLLQKLNTKLKVFTDMSKLQMDFTLLKERLAQLEDGWTNGGFEWLDGMLVQALQAGDWLLMDNVNFCASVLDRLNALLEPNGSLTINERGVIDGKTPRITPHPNFLFLTMDPVHGELSRAMRNRGVEVYIPGEREGLCWDTLDLKTLLHSASVTGNCVCDLLIQIHQDIRSAIWSSVAALLHAASLLSCQLQRGADLRSALQHACTEVYAFCQRSTANQKVIEQHLVVMDTGAWGDGLLCAGVWPDSFPSALLSTEDSCFSSVLRDGQVLLFCLNSLSLQGKNRPLRLRDLQQALQSSGVHEDCVFSGGVLDLEDGDALRLVPTAVRLVTERASHGDWILRSHWLSNLGKSSKYLPPALVHVEAGNRALKAVFSSTLAAKGKTLAELLQPHSKEYRILMDMRWNKQYLDILTNKCNFEDEERYMEFLEALNAVANIVLMMDREERAVSCSCTVSVAPPTSSLRVATAFSKSLDISQLPHPVLMHLRAFFDRWDAYVLQAVQNGQPHISDHVMFEILQLLRWRDHFWDVCVMLPADSQGVSVLSLHWQWLQKHLILRLPQLLMGDTAATLGQQDLQAVSAAIQNLLSTPVSVAAALKGMQRSLGKALPYKLEAVAECASRLRLFSMALDVNALQLDEALSWGGQQLLRVQAAGLWLDIKESLLEASGLVLSANNQLDPHKSVLEKLLLSVEQLQSHMTSRGLSGFSSMSDGEAEEGEVHMGRAGLLQLRTQTQLWPLMEGLSVLNQLLLSADLLHLALSPRHLRFCLQSTPMNVGQLQSLWFLLSSNGEKLPLVWCDLLSEALAALWSCSVTSDPTRWLRWNPVDPETQKDLTPRPGAENMGPGLLNKAVWSRCMLGVLSRGEVQAEAPLSCGVSLGEWEERVQQLEVVSSVLWENLTFPATAHFVTDLRLQGAVLRRQLQSMADLLPPHLQEGYMESCESLVQDATPLTAAQEIQTLLKNFLPPQLLPEGLMAACTACLQQFVQVKGQGGDSLAQCGVFWVNMGLLQIRVWTPQTIFDPAVKRSYKLNYAQQELALLQDEWKARSASSELKSGEELKESSTTDGFQHPRIYLWIRMQQVKEQIAELSRKQAFRPQQAQYGRLYRELQHYLSSVGHMSAVEELLSRLLKALQDPSYFRSGSAVRALLREEAGWQNSQQRFCQKLLDDYPMFPDLVGPVRTGLLQLRHGMRLVASQLATSLTHVPGLSKLVSCLVSFPSVSPGLPSDLDRAQFLCSRTCIDVVHSLEKLLPQQEAGSGAPQPSALLLNALLYVRCHSLSTGELSEEACSLFRHICQAVVNEWDNQEKRKQEQEQLEASLYRSRSRLHGSGLTQDQQDETDFRRHFPQFSKDFADILSQPSLEGPADTEPEHEADAAAASLSGPAINTLVQVHQCVCLGYAQSLWYQGTPPTNHSKEHIKALISSHQIASPVMTHFYHLSELDLQLAGCGLLLSALLQNTVSGSGGSDELALSSEGPYDFYQQPNMREARLCLPVLEQLSEAVKTRLEEWPEHPALVQLNVVMDRIRSFSLACPLAKFLNGLEILLGKAQDWENNASRAVSLRKELEPVTQLIIQWRKLELCWSSSLDNALKRHTEKSTKHWFSLYQLVERYLQEQDSLSLSSVSSTLEAFMEGSTLGEFHTRLRMLLSFHCHLLLVPDLPSLSRLLWNLHRYYSQFSESVQAKILQLRQPIEKELKDFVKISKWNDVSYWSIKQSVEKTQTLFKFVKRFEDALSGPSLAALVEQRSSSSWDPEPAGSGDAPIQRVHQALKSAMPGQGRELQNEDLEEGTGPSSLQARLPVLFRKMKKMSIQLLKRTSVPELAEDLDEIISNLGDLQSLSIDTAAAKEKQQTEVKHILQQKQRALSDLFKMLSEILSYRKGLIWNRTADPESTLCMHPLEMTTALSAVKTQGQPERLFTELLGAWEGCQKYFYRSWARRTALLTALQHASKELGVGNIERCRGFSSHLFKLLLRQRHRLAQLTQHWVSLKLTASLQNIQTHLQSHSEDGGCYLPPQDSLQDWFRRGRGLAAQSATLLQQLSWLLQCCPEEPQQREQTGASSRRHTLMCPSPLAVQQQPPGCLLRRGDPGWTQLQQQVAAMLKDSQSVKPAVTQSLNYVRGQVETAITEFTSWRSQLLVEDLLKPGHLTRLLEAELEAEVEALSVGSVSVAVTKLLGCVRRHRDSCPPSQLQQEVNRACRALVRFLPLLGVYSDLARYYLSVSLAVHRSTGKLLSVLSSIFTQLAQKSLQGFCLPQELMPGGDADGATEFHDYEGGGIGDGDGTKDVSDKIENEDQVEDSFQEGAEKEEQQNLENIKSEDNGIEMSEDFDGRVHDGDENEGEDNESDEEEEEELDKKMGDLGEGQTDTLDERMWGDDEEDDEEEGSEKEEESGQGMDQREFDENEVDPYHGQQEQRPEPEAMDLPDDLNLDQEEEAGGDDDEDGDENPLDIDDKVMEVELKEEEQRDGEEEESGETEMENQRDDEQNQEPKSEEEDEKGHEKQEEAADEDEEEKEGKENREAQEEKDKAAGDDSGEKPKQEDEAESEDDEQPSSAERKEHSADGQTGEQNIQSDSAVELAGAAAETDQAKEEHGSGAADASQSEGHQSKLTARMASQKQTQSQTQSFKRKPGQADNERSTGDYSERVNKRLRTVESSQECSESRQADSQHDSDLYEHIRPGETAYDSQTYVASAEQQKAAGPLKDQDEDGNDDVAMETEDQEEQLQSADVEELKPEQLETSKFSQKVESGEAEQQRQDEEDERLKERQPPGEEEKSTRSSESTIHTAPPEELRREMELQLEAWRQLAPGTQEEEAAAASMWLQYQALTSALSQQLCEQLRLILEPTQAAKLGDYRTGKRLNMRKVIPYIASQFRKDKIWLRRTKPSKREYQICLAVDDSSSMVDNHSKQLAFESLSVIINALTLLEVGQVSVCFGEQMQLLHPFQQQFNDESGARILRLCQFQQKKTRIAQQFLETSTKMFLSARQQIPGSLSSETAQLLLIVSDGRGLFLEGKERVVTAVQAARTANIFVIFVVLDNPNTRLQDSILDIKVPIFKGPGELPEIRSYMDEFPFPFYVILRDVNALPETLSDALRQWFELITAA
uniref:Midasin n=1 Tax=Xiphophorus maculatus TaxID=8083 RepID=M4AJ01_XIPMA